MNTTPPVSPDAAPAHALWIELATRITSQRLHYRSGNEETAAKSVASLFQKVRDLLEKNPQAAKFRNFAVSLLNDTLRPYTARWDGWMTEDKERKDKDGLPVRHFYDAQVRRKFREELQELQTKLTAAQSKLAKLAGIQDVSAPQKLEPAGGSNLPRTRAREFFTGEYIQGRTESLQQIKLTDLGASAAAPYHLINTTLNLPNTDNKEWRGRNNDFFVVTKHFCGAPVVGYVPTAQVEKLDPHFDLGTAMAVSGAAASTSMGWKSLPHFRFLMTLFNVRLGYWIRRPGAWTLGWLLEGPGPFYLFREMLGSMHERCRYLNLSDGGHIENLATYELLRRKCKFIMCVDAGQEPGMECADLIRLQRYASIDLGIEMGFSLKDVALQTDGFSRAYALLVKIDYTPEQGGLSQQPKETGWMLYVKLAMTGTEPPYVSDYKRENPLFPHQSTGDQFYDEAQFEAYRMLGECAAENLFRDEIIEGFTPANLRDWFQHLADKLLPDNDAVFGHPAAGVNAPAPAASNPPSVMAPGAAAPATR